MKHAVVIIGGGLVGAATAYYLTRAGCAVALIEQGEINNGASGQNAGSLHFQMEHRLIEHGDALAELAATIMPLSLDAISRWGGIEAELDQRDLDIVMHGGLMLAETPEQVAKLERKRRLEERWGLPTRLMDKSELLATAPYLGPTAVAASYCPVEGHGNARLITAALVRAALVTGHLDLFTQCAVQSTLRQGSRWEVGCIMQEGMTRTFSCDALLNASGAWAAEVAALADLHLPVFPVALSMNATEAAPPLIGHLLQHVGRRLSMKQLAEGNILLGGGWSARMVRRGSAFDRNTRPDFRLDSIRGNIEVALDVVPALKHLHLLRSWTGTVGITSDGLPIVGEVPQAPGYFVATGGSAFTLGLTYGALVSELIVERRTDLDISLFSPARFGPLNMFMGGA